ncbi:FecR family protein [Pseudomonas fragi]|uniref:FecR family protein n=1 Tax=Pseudomonas fragi TaxID=296 RepID=UPI000BA2028B|nr:FecR family protein [Pseudomonas fragi]PAA32364.1 iron dicitrate transport regulator FecR [Pseudomonas fragi]PAA40752.1 iron dicitrate transport regulator FecR [Pseudomonas fragi]WOL29894.1 FecR family protein [Pseudomonas fragi]
MSTAKVDPTTRAAIDWMLRLESGQACPSERQVFKAWLAENPAHLAAWQRVAGVLKAPVADLQSVERRSPGQLQAVRRALLAGTSPSGKKTLQGGLLLLVLGLGAAGLVDRVTPLTGLTADYQTATGERKTVELADGSLLTLNARSAVDIDFNSDQRRVHLREGELQVDVAADAQRPFVVSTAQGQVQALGTRFMVRQGSTESLASVQQHSVQLHTLGGQQLHLETGRAASFTATRINPQTPTSRSQPDWLAGRVELHDEPLSALVEALRPYQTGMLRISPEAARVRVFGVFPLDNTAHTLNTLAQTLPIKITRYGPWLTLIDVRQ